MPLWEAAILGLVQGLAEFLPISSSGHLVLFHALFGVEEGALAFDVLLHMGTLIAVLIYFREDWIRLVRIGFKTFHKFDWSDPDVRLLVLLIVATIPGALAGALFEKKVELLFHNADAGPIVVACALGIMGGVLLLAERIAKHTRAAEAMSWVDALIIGLAQAVALVPGVSRSGATMTAALFLGLRRSDAAWFSFLMSGIITAGAGLMKVPKIFLNGEGGEAMAPLLVGFLVSGISGYLAIRFLMRYIQTNSFNIFGYYRIAVALLLLFIYLR